MLGLVINWNIEESIDSFSSISLIEQLDISFSFCNLRWCLEIKHRLYSSSSNLLNINGIKWIRTYDNIGLVNV